MSGFLLRRCSWQFGGLLVIVVMVPLLVSCGSQPAATPTPVERQDISPTRMVPTATLSSQDVSPTRIAPTVALPSTATRTPTPAALEPLTLRVLSPLEGTGWKSGP